MKLLSWMHRKLQNDNTSPFKGSALGNSCLSLKPSLGNQDNYVRSGNNCKVRCEHYLEQFKGEQIIDINREESAEIFPGFLTIGTLSVEPVTGPPTPTFHVPHQKTDEYGTGEMKCDLKSITEKLENFLRDEAEKEGNNEPSGRNSQASNVTLSDNKEKEEADDHKYMDTQTFPLRGYLLASSTELSEIQQKGKKERTSLQELFQNGITTDKRSSIEEAAQTKKKAKKKIKSSTHVINKMLQTPWLFLKDSTTSTGCAVESFPTVTKLRKIRQLFHKKIHPQISPADKDPNMFSKNETGKILNRSSDSYADSPAPGLDCESTRMSCWSTLMRRENHQPNTGTKLPRDASTKEKVNIAPNYECGTASKEQWINTDADYLVLELQRDEELQY